MLCLVVSATCAVAQVGKWDAVRYEKWGFSLQIPSGSTKQAVNQSEGEACDIYSAGGIACVVKVILTPDNQLASTMIEQAIQTEVKAASSPGPAKRWEQTSKQGDLYKGFTAPIDLAGDDPLLQAAAKIVAEPTAFQSVAMAPLGDDTSAVLRITVIGPMSRQRDVVATAKGITAFVTRTIAAKAPLVSTSGPKRVILQPKPTPKPEPKPKPEPTAKPQRALKKGEIELAGIVGYIAADRKSMVLAADSVRMPGGEPTALDPSRPKKVTLRKKLDWLTAGQRVRITGKNTGIGKPMTADTVERVTDTRPTQRSTPSGRTAPA